MQYYIFKYFIIFIDSNFYNTKKKKRTEIFTTVLFSNDSNKNYFLLIYSKNILKSEFL